MIENTAMASLPSPQRGGIRAIISLTIALGVGLLAGYSQSPRHDLVLTGGRVMDPATGLDARRDVGISGGKIVAISDGALTGTTVVDVSGLVVAPGFIDLHAHGQTRGGRPI